MSIFTRFIDTLSRHVDGGNMKVGHTSYNSSWEKCAAQIAGHAGIHYATANRYVKTMSEADEWIQDLTPLVFL